MPLAENQPKIMVVDDTVANLKLLEEMLGRQGYQVRSFPRGRLALAAAAREQPDLILLDIQMPEMDGFEVCQLLKADPVLAPIPVVFISAQHETMDKVGRRQDCHHRPRLVDFLSGNQPVRSGHRRPRE